MTTFYIFRCISNISLSSKNTQAMHQKRVTFCNFWNSSSHRNDCFWFLELFLVIYQGNSVCFSVWNVFFFTYLFLNSLLHNNVLIAYCRHIPPLRILRMNSSSAVATTPLMANNLAATPYIYPLFLPLAVHRSKNFHDHYITTACW